MFICPNARSLLRSGDSSHIFHAVMEKRLSLLGAPVTTMCYYYAVMQTFSLPSLKAEQVMN